MHIKGAHCNSVDLIGEAETKQEMLPALMADATVGIGSGIDVLMHPIGWR
jgi:hypothetical protein